LIHHLDQLRADLRQALRKQDSEAVSERFKTYVKGQLADLVGDERGSLLAGQLTAIATYDPLVHRD
jgi:hypothetical protein